MWFNILKNAYESAWGKPAPDWYKETSQPKHDKKSSEVKYSELMKDLQPNLDRLQKIADTIELHRSQPSTPLKLSDQISQNEQNIKIISDIGFSISVSLTTNREISDERASDVRHMLGQYDDTIIPMMNQLHEAWTNASTEVEANKA